MVFYNLVTRRLVLDSTDIVLLSFIISYLVGTSLRKSYLESEDVKLKRLAESIIQECLIIEPDKISSTNNPDSSIASGLFRSSSTRSKSIRLDVKKLEIEMNKLNKLNDIRGGENNGIEHFLKKIEELKNRQRRATIINALAAKMTQKFGLTDQVNKAGQFAHLIIELDLTILARLATAMARSSNLPKSALGLLFELISYYHLFWLQIIGLQVRRCYDIEGNVLVFLTGSLSASGLILGLTGSIIGHVMFTTILKTFFLKSLVQQGQNARYYIQNLLFKRNAETIMQSLINDMKEQGVTQKEIEERFTVLEPKPSKPKMLEAVDAEIIDKKVVFFEEKAPVDTDSLQSEPKPKASVSRHTPRKRMKTFNELINEINNDLKSGIEDEFENISNQNQPEPIQIKADK